MTALSSPDKPLPKAIKSGGLPTPQRYFAITALLASIVLAVLDGSIVNIALPTMAASLHISAADVVWVAGAYQLAIVVTLLPFAALGESRGYKQVFMTGTFVFMLASGCCAFAGTLPLLILARVTQGFGAAAILSVFAALLRHTYPSRYIGRAIGLNALTVSLSSAIGPTLGATVLAIADWPWLFLINLPVCVLVLVAGRALPDVEGLKRRIDLRSAILNAAVLGLLILALDRVAQAPLLSLVMIVVACISLVFLVRREGRQAAPLVPLDLLRIPDIRLSGIAALCAFMAQNMIFIGLPFYLQRTLGQSEVMTGLLMTPWPLAAAITAAVVGFLSDKVSTALICALGCVLVSIAAVLAGLWPLAQNVWPLIAFNAIGGVGFGCFQSPNNRTMLMSAPLERSGAVGGLQATARQIGLSGGAALAALLFTLKPVTAPVACLLCGAVLALLAGVTSLVRRGREPSR